MVFNEKKKNVFRRTQKEHNYLRILFQSALKSSFLFSFRIPKILISSNLVTLEKNLYNFF